jgi:hypothetical protein
VGGDLTGNLEELEIGPCHSCFLTANGASVSRCECEERVQLVRQCARLPEFTADMPRDGRTPELDAREVAEALRA